MSEGITTKEFSDYSAEASTLATAVSGVAGAIRDGAIAQANHLDALADAYVKDYQKYADVAVDRMNQAASAGNENARKVYEKIAVGYQDLAGQKQALGTTAYLNKISQNAKAAAAGLAKHAGPAADILNIGIGAVDAALTGDTRKLGEASIGALAGFGAAALVGAALVGAPVWVTAVLVTGAAVAASEAVKYFWNAYVDYNVNTGWVTAQAFTNPPRRDPLTLDLDGDGLETSGIDIANPILFDHDGDGVKNGTGWVDAARVGRTRLRYAV